MATQFDWDGKGERPKYEYKMSEEALDMNRNATPEEQKLFLQFQKIVFAGTGFFEDDEDEGGD